MKTAAALLAGAILSASTALLIPSGSAHSDPAESLLPAFNADITQTSISGISSGAFMAVQFGTAWSSVIKGVGAIAGGPFGCSEGSGAAALSTCMGGMPAPDLSELIQRTDAWSRSGGIDDTAKIAAQKIYLFSGYNDKVVARAVSDSLNAFYAHYLGPNPGNLFYQTAIGAGHSQVTADFGGACSDNGGEFINNCGYDQAGVILQHIYGALNPRKEGTLSGRFLPFNQADFTGSDQPIDDSMDGQGLVYVPASCDAREPCHVHVALHGCLQSFGDIGDHFVKHAGYNEWADTNHIIVLYPQIHAVSVTALGISNPQSCWDWWGYLDADPTESPTYLLKSGKQISAIKAMVDRLTSGTPALPTSAEVQSEAPKMVHSPDRSDTAIEIVWSPVPGANRYDVFRAGPGDDDFHRIATVSGVSYGDGGLRPATQYRYEVRAFSAIGSSPFSPIASQTTLPQVPPCDEPGSCVVN